MKKCPNCDKEFPDSMRFCQTDGTLLVEKVEDVDPYKTVVGNQGDIASAMPPLDPFKTMVAPPPPKADDDILGLSDDQDSLKTMVVSQDELKAEMKPEKEDAPLDLPPPVYAPSAPLIQPKAASDAPPAPKQDKPFSMPPKFDDPPAPKQEDADSSAATAIIDKEDIPPAPPSPFESKPFENDFSGKSPYGNQENKPIPSPFDLSMPPGYMPPSVNPFGDPKPDSPPVKQTAEEPKPSSSPFDAPKPFDAPTPFGNADPFNQNQPVQQAEWTPPPAPDASFQNQEMSANTPSASLAPPAGQSLNQTLPIISLVLGILSICCYAAPITGIAALITGFLGMKNANSNPSQYGGKTLAIVGMVLGGLFFLIGVAYYIFWLVIGLGSLR